MLEDGGEGVWGQSEARARVHAFARLKETLMKRSHCVDREEIDGGKMLDAPKNKAPAATSSVSNYLLVERRRRRESPLNNHHPPPPYRLKRAHYIHFGGANYDYQELIFASCWRFLASFGLAVYLFVFILHIRPPDESEIWWAELLQSPRYIWRPQRRHSSLADPRVLSCSSRG